MNEKSFAEQVDDVLSGKDHYASHLKVCDNTPGFLKLVGFEDFPMYYTAIHLKHAVKEKNKGFDNHGLKAEQIKRLPECLADPVRMLLSRK